VVEEINSNEVNTHFLVYELFDGDADKALDVARRFSQCKFTMTPKSIERHMILEYIEQGVSDEEIVRVLTRGDYEIKIKRVERLRKEFEDGKYRDR